MNIKFNNNSFIITIHNTEVLGEITNNTVRYHNLIPLFITNDEILKEYNDYRNRISKYNL